MNVILASAGALMIGVAVVILGIAVLLHLGNQVDRRRNTNVRGCTGVCIPDRSNTLTGAHTEDRPAYGRGDWQPDQQSAGQAVREVSTSTTYNGRGEGGKHAPMTTPTEGEEWKYPVQIPERAGDAPIPVEVPSWWKVKR